jgi:hypothetical protein
MRKDLLERFWSIYETDGTLQALSWLETLKYFEEYCQSDIEYLTGKLADVL